MGWCVCVCVSLCLFLEFNFQHQNIVCIQHQQQPQQQQQQWPFEPFNGLIFFHLKYHFFFSSFCLPSIVFSKSQASATAIHYYLLFIFVIFFLFFSDLFGSHRSPGCFVEWVSRKVFIFIQQFLVWLVYGSFSSRLMLGARYGRASINRLDVGFRWPPSGIRVGFLGKLLAQSLSVGAGWTQKAGT